MKNIFNKKNEMIYSPLIGNVAELDRIEKDIFKKMNHNAIKIVPIEGKVYAPFDGRVSVIAPSKHVIVVTDKWENEVYIHIGTDTVELEGRFFCPLVKCMGTMKQGQEILTFEMKEIENAGYRLDSIVYITNKGRPLDILPVDGLITKENILYQVNHPHK